MSYSPNFNGHVLKTPTYEGWERERYTLLKCIKCEAAYQYDNVIKEIIKENLMPGEIQRYKPEHKFNESCNELLIRGLLDS